MNEIKKVVITHSSRENHYTSHQLCSRNVFLTLGAYFTRRPALDDYQQVSALKEEIT